MSQHERKFNVFKDVCLRIERGKNGGFTITNMVNVMPTYDELKELADGIYEFLSNTSPEKVSAHNEYYYAEYKKEWMRMNEGYCDDFTSRKKPERKITGGFVYFIKEHHSNTIKIGRTVDIKNRSTQFGVKLPFEWDFVKIVKCSDYVKLEEDLHSILSDKRVSGEWFKIDVTDIDDALSKMDVDFTDVTKEKAAIS